MSAPHRQSSQPNDSAGLQEGAGTGGAPVFQDALRPWTVDRFLAEQRTRAPLHLSGRDWAYDRLMSWDGLNELLNMTGIWSSSSLQLVSKGQPIPPQAYCRTAVGRDGGEVAQPDALRVMEHLKRGATLIANDIDSLSPALRRFADSMEAALGGKVQANLYCSWDGHQGFGSHFDTHEVYALHVAGEKVWRVYEGRLDRPIAHPYFQEFDEDYHRAHRGPVVMEPCLRPGDLLYIPRGQYHDATANSEGTIHIAFGVTYPIGLDIMTLLQDLAVSNGLFREDLPLASVDSDGSALRQRTDELAAALQDICASQMLRDGLRRMRDGMRYDRGGFELPVSARPEYRRVASGLRVVQASGTWLLESKKGRLPIPGGLEDLVAWVVERESFDGSALAEAFPDRSPADLTKFLNDMRGMRVIDVA